MQTRTETYPSPRDIVDAAVWLDANGIVSSDAFAPRGLGSMTPQAARRMLAFATAQGWTK